jgi:dynein heavy chain
MYRSFSKTIYLYFNIIKDLFPGIEKPNVNVALLLAAINQVCKNMILQPTQPFVDKIIQLYDTIQVRHGLMLVGPTGGGKTSDYKVLSAAMTSL